MPSGSCWNVDKSPRFCLPNPLRQGPTKPTGARQSPSTLSSSARKCTVTLPGKSAQYVIRATLTNRDWTGGWQVGPENNVPRPGAES